MSHKAQALALPGLTATLLTTHQQLVARLTAIGPATMQRHSDSHTIWIELAPQSTDSTATLASSAIGIPA